MGKANKKSSTKNETVKKCTCDHPYQCSCGNRPERPSKGHKWDPETQQWGGKGHKQKGASIQAATIGQAEKVTIGNVSIKQWQKLPSDILKELCKKNGKGVPIYRSDKSQGGKQGYRYRLIVPDTNKKGAAGEHDVVLTPSLPVPNEEQAKEEAALLGLLYLFPTLPHERTLPEPYRSTFLGALKNSQGDSDATKGDNKKGKAGGKEDKVNVNGSEKVDAASDAVAKANTQLTANLPSFQKGRNNTSQTSSTSAPLLTKAQIKEARQQHQREVQARIRKHEAIRNANKPMEVFMCASMRRRIERLLAGESNMDMMDDEEDVLEDDAADAEEDVIRSYVRQRLVHEGFTPGQVRKAYRAVFPDANESNGNNADQQMDKAYEETLQYLCIHLNEDQLPIGFDPRGGTLDVVRPVTKSKSGGSTKEKVDNPAADNENYDTTVIQFANQFGLLPKEAHAILSSEIPADAKPISNMSESEQLMQKWKLWSALCTAASLPMERSCFLGGNDISDDTREMNKETASNELEALGAIFDGQDFSTSKVNNTTCVSIWLPYEDSQLVLEVIYSEGVYPELLPMAFLTCGNDVSGAFRAGGQLHVKMIRFLKTLEPGQEVIFELFGHVQELIQDIDASSTLDVASELLCRLNVDDNEKSAVDSSNAKISNDDESNKRQVKPKAQNSLKPSKRPREKSTFWNTSPKDTPPAKSFPKLEKARKSLPAAKARDEFLSLMEQAAKGGRVVLVTGETGCGKTTQIPQFILENSPTDSKIVVAQPRRLAATGVATRVAIERGETKAGAGVGYSVRGDSKYCSSTRLLFCTTGVLLRQLQSESALQNISHIIIDEVHERHLDSDVLLAILKQVLPSNPHLSVVLMSATMDADRFASYWGNQTPRIHIKGFTHPVKDFMLEDVLKVTGYIPSKKKSNTKGGSGSYQIQPSFIDGDTIDSDDDEVEENPSISISLEDRVKRMDTNDIDYNLIAVLIEHILQTKTDDGSILIFLPGAGEIERAERTIHQIIKSPVNVLPLHGGLQPEKQNEVFLPSTKGTTKVIISTNVAETSITIPDVTVVIDTCKEKQSSFDPVNRMPLLLERFASQDSLRQRRGRAGRVRPGICYKLISRQQFSKLAAHGEPEIKRCALDQTILSLLFLGLEDGTGTFLRMMIDPPSHESIESALACLEKIGAIIRTDSAATLTPLGNHLAGIPAPPAVGKLLVMGCLLGCRNISLAIAAGLSVGRSPFIQLATPAFQKGRQQNGRGGEAAEKEATNNGQVLEARAALFKTVGNSEHALLGKAYLLWEDAKGVDKRKCCDRLGLAFNIMREMHQLVQQLHTSISSLGFIETECCNIHSNSWRVVRAVIVSALAPSQVIRVQRPTTKYQETVEGAVEKDGKAKDMKFFIRSGDASNPRNEERVFIHPSSNMFSVATFSCPWLVYHRVVRTSKAYIHDATESSAYALLLFAGKMDVQASKGLVILDDRIELSANARIGSLMGGLRKKMECLLETKVSDPSLDISDTSEMKLVADLLRHDGLGK